MDMSLEH